MAVVKRKLIAHRIRVVYVGPQWQLHAAVVMNRNVHDATSDATLLVLSLVM